MSRVVAAFGRSFGIRAARTAAAAMMLAGLLGRLLIFDAAAAEHQVGDVVVVSEGAVNLRSDAGTDGAIRAVIGTGENMEILQGPRADDGYNWYRVNVLGVGQHAGMTGWVAENFIVNEDDGGALANAPGVEIKNGPVNVRKAPGLDGTILTVLNSGFQIPTNSAANPKLVHADGYDWLAVRFGNGKAGFVATDYLTPLDFTPNLGSDDGGAIDSFLGALGARVADGPVNVRSTPSLNGTALTTLNTGAEVPVNGATANLTTSGGYTWLGVLFGNGIQGYIATDFLQPLDYAPNLGSDDGWTTATGFKVIDGPVNARVDPSLDAAIVGTLDTGRVVNRRAKTDLVSADGHTWIRFNSLYSEPHDGWVAIDFLQPLQEVPCGDGACYPDEIVDFIGATQAVVVDGPVNFRTDAGQWNDVILQLKTGDYVFMQAGDGKFSDLVDGYYWVQATVNGEIGWIAVDFLDPIK
jgi:uncharacterized protein YgiM (DUF1202 family)